MVSRDKNGSSGFTCFLFISSRVHIEVLFVKVHVF